MSDTVISVDSLAKKYVIGHERAQKGRETFREMLLRSARGVARSAAQLAKGQPITAGDEIEEFWALDDVSFDVRRGEVLGIIGANGAGKSTLLKILSRITEPTKGRAVIAGRVASLLEVGTGFHAELTGRENIFLNGAILGMTRREVRHKLDEIIDFAGVEKFIDTPVKRYSSGMYVRLAFSVAAHLEPEIMIVDEVLAVGDAEFQKKCMGKMSSVASGGRTVLFVSHNMGAVATLCGRALLLRNGTIATAGDAGSVIAGYMRSVGGQSRVGFPASSSRPSITAIELANVDSDHGDFDLAIEFESPVAFTPSASVRMYSASGVPVWGSNSLVHPCIGFGGQSTRGILTCRVRGLPLLFDTYTISVFLFDQYETYDFKVDALNFSIGSPGRTGANSPTVVGNLDWQAKWHSGDLH